MIQKHQELWIVVQGFKLQRLRLENLQLSKSILMNEEDYYPEQQDLGKESALKLKWSLGLNYHIYDGVHNLTNQSRKQIFIPVANQGVIFDYENNLQRQLQGHCNQISATAYNKKRDIIVTADTGQDSMLVVWDVDSGTPKKTIFNPHPDGVLALDINEDGTLIVTLSKAAIPTQQVVTLWKWEEQDPCYISAQMDQKVDCMQKFIKFNHNQKEFATTGQSRILFWLWQDNQRGFQLYSPQIPAKKSLTQTVFIPNSPQAVSGTKEGVIIVWDISLIMEDYTQPEERRAIKTVNLMNNPNKIDQMKKVNSSPAISILKIQGRFLVIGSSNGSIRFYDDQYRIQAWFEDIDLGAVHTISFSSLTQDGQNQLGDSHLDPDKNKDYPEFFCNDFIVVDDNARITMLKSSLFQKIDKQEKKGVVLMESIVAPIVCSAVRPYSNALVISCQNGTLYEWNFIEKPKSISVLRSFGPGQVPTCVNYSPKGKYLSVATKIGTIHIYEVETGTWQPSPLLVAEVQKSRPAIHMQTFSPDSRHLAVMDEDFGVTLFILGQKPQGSNQQAHWSFAGKVRVHYAPIRSISFGQSIDQRGEVRLRLFSIAEDMKLAEYDVVPIKKDDKNETKYNRLKLKSITQIQQQCFPTACIWYPVNMFKENILLTVNEHYKIKLWSMLKDNMKICKKTCLGPTYGGQINKLLVLNPADEKNDYQDKYLAYATKEKVVGIIKLPLDGNPNNTMGLIAHPSKITSISSLVDGKMFFTSGGEDLCVNMWEVDFSILAESFCADPNEDPFPQLLEGGSNGQVMSDLKDFFYYSQIRSKDEHTTKARKLDGKVPLEAIANMMRSMGFYPTQKQIENMQNEIRFSKYIDNYKETLSQLDLDMFLKLFVNNRPVYGISKNHIVNALSILGNVKSDGSPYITREEMFKILTSEGERMTEQEIRECEKILLGDKNQLPEQIDADTLCHKVLGFQDLDNPDETGEQALEQAEQQ